MVLTIKYNYFWYIIWYFFQNEYKYVQPCRPELCIPAPVSIYTPHVYNIHFCKNIGDFNHTIYVCVVPTRFI